MSELIRSSTGLAISLGGVVNIVLLSRAAAARVRRGELDRGALLTVFVLTGTSVLLQTTYLVDSDSMKAGFLVLAVAACLAVTYRRGAVHEHHAVPAPAIVGLLLWIWLYLSDLIHNPGMSRSLILAATGAGFLWFSALLAAARTRLTGFAFAASLGLSMSALVIVTPFTSAGWRGCDEYKCNVTGALFRGPFSSENYLAMQMVFLALFALVYLTGTARTSVLLFSLLVCVAAGSRTSLLVVLACLVVGRLFSSEQVSGRSTRTGLGVFYGWLVFAAAWLATAVHIVESSPPDRFSDRGAIWQAGLRALHGHRIFGLGLDRWSDLQRYGTLPDHYPHDVYLLFWFSGGVVALGLLGLWIASVLTRLTTTSRGRFPPALIAIAFLLIGVTEVVWNPLTFDGLSWVAIAMSVVATDGVAQRSRTTVAGLPIATDRGGTSFATTAPAPITQPAPMRTPGRIVARAPIHTSSSMTTSLGGVKP